MIVDTREFVESHQLLGCIQCGRCTAGCPVSLKTALNIRDIIYKTLVLDQVDITTWEELWDCTACRTCQIRCPKELDPCDVVIGLRTLLVGEGRHLPHTVRDALKSIAIRGNPLGYAMDDRAVWAGELGFAVENIFDKGETDVLFYVGCSPSFDMRIQPITRALATVFHDADVDFAILGEDEPCCCNEARRMGEAEMFEEMVLVFKEEMLPEFACQRMVTVSPHCFNAFKNEYDLPFPVQHYTEFLVELMADGRLSLDREIPARVTFHDPCFLGKQNQVFDEPRQILTAIPGIELIELDRSRERSQCCEGGGGRMWAEGTNLEVRLSVERVQQAVDVGAELLVTACPFCVMTLEDAVKIGGFEDQVRVVELMELVAQAM
jgi:Fe-S oxidoreductase